MNWYVVVYGQNNTILAAWEIHNRSEDEAELEASHEINTMSLSNLYDTWTMIRIPYNS